MFGPETHAGVVSFQRAQNLRADGVIDMHTWAKLVATVPPKQGSAGRSAYLEPVADSSTHTDMVNVADWPLTLRFEKVLRLVPGYLSPELAMQFRAMVTPANIGILVGSLAAWAVSHAFGAGEIIDVILLGVGAVFVGMAIFKAGEDLGDCLTITLHAKETADLEKAADLLAQAIVILGITAFLALLAKVSARFARAGGSARKRAAAGAGAIKEGKAPSGPEPELKQTPEANEPPKPPARTPAKLAEGFAERARPAEVRTAERLTTNPEFDGRTFDAPPPPDPGYDWTDDLGRTYDAMGDGTKSRYFNLKQFTSSIDSHLLKGNDFTVIDMTGYTPEQVAAVKAYVDGLPASSQALIRRIGF